MTHTIVNPPELHDPTGFGYSHSVGVSPGHRFVFVAGQYGSGSDGQVVSPSFPEQVERAFQNLASALAGQGFALGDVVQLRTYIVGIDFDKLGAVSGAVRARWGTTPPTQTMLGVAGLALPDIAFEVEAVAAREVASEG